MLTAVDDEYNIIQGFEMGADDYVTKPFSPRELTARIKAGLRRQGVTNNEDILYYGDITVIQSSYEVLQGTKKIDITLKKQGMAEVKDARSYIIEALHDANGFLPLNDKSAPELIYEELEMSKKVFKKAIGNLYKDKMITIKRDGIHLAEQPK